MILLSSEEKARLRLSVNPEVLDYIEEIKEEQNLSFNGDAVSFLVADYQRLKKEQWSLNYVAEVVSKNLHETLKEELTRIRLGTNNTDRNTQIITEVLNGMLINDNVEGLVTSDVMEAEGITSAKNVVQERIEIKTKTC